jgi:hypothetical protein
MNLKPWLAFYFLSPHRKCMPAPHSPQNSISLLHMDITLIADCETSCKETPTPKFNI